MPDRWTRLTHQSRARELTADEMALANALEAIFTSRVSDFTEVARLLSADGVIAPQSRRRDWDTALLQSELDAINRSLDDAYARFGIGA